MEENKNEEEYVSKFDFKEFFLKYILRFLISLAVSLIIFGLVIWIRGWNYSGISDGLFIAGAVALAEGLFSIITNLGFFDLFAYNATRLRSLFQKYEKINYHGVYEYTESKKEKRSKGKFNSIPYLIVGVIFIVVALLYTFLAV